MTVDEEFNKLDDDIRRLKIEYEVYFNGGTPRPPRDTLFRVETMFKRYSSDQSKLSFSQRYRFTNMLQRYAVNSQLWRRRLQEKEEGRSLTTPLKRPPEVPVENGNVRVVCSDPDAEPEKVIRLLEAMKAARMRVGDNVSRLDPETFHKFIKEKTRQVKEALGCDKVQFSISIEDGKVKFKATRAD